MPSLEDAETIASTLVMYGQELFRAGAAYGRYSETINAVASASWDLAFAWQAEEPHLRGALLAILAWAGLLRIGEATGAVSEDLILPDDAAPGTQHALLQMLAPKTRGRAARHQAARLDPPDVIALLRLAFGHLHRHQRLWPFSPGTLRRGFNTIQQRLGNERWKGPL